MKGGGKYEAEAAQARVATKAEGVLLLVLGGHKGNRFEVQVPLHAMPDLPKILRATADQIEQDLRGLQPPMARN